MKATVNGRTFWQLREINAGGDWVQNPMLEASSDLMTWLRLRTTTFTALTVGFEDTAAASFRHRFRERLVGPQ